MKKSIGKKKKVVEPKVVEESIEMPEAKNDGEDVDEDYKVLDMSKIEAPVIEFVMPNLTELKPEKNAETSSKNEGEETEKAVTRSSTKKENAEILTANNLNNEIVKLRNNLKTAKARLVSKLVRRKKDFESKAGKIVEKKEHFLNSAKRLGDEIESIKTIDKDTVIKFALLNEKNLNQLNISAATAVSERLMYKLATHEVMVKATADVKKKYKNFNKTAAFLLQRLGKQYAHKKKEKIENEEKEEDDKNAENGEDELEVEFEEEEGTQESETNVDEGGEDFDTSDVEIAVSDEEAESEAASKRREMLLGLIGVTEDKSRPKLKPKKRKIVDMEENEGSSKKKVVKEELKNVLKKELEKADKIVVKKQKKEKKQQPVKKSEVVKEVVPEVEAEDAEDEISTVVRKIKLSDGGTIEKTARNAGNESKPETKEIKTIAKDDDEDEDEDESAFFLPKEGEVKTTKVSKSTKNLKKAPKSKEPEVKKNANKGASKKQNQTGEMHPSWAASQQKKKELQAKPCGKKITFGDDDE